MAQKTPGVSFAPKLTGANVPAGARTDPATRVILRPFACDTIWALPAYGSSLVRRFNAHVRDQHDFDELAARMKTASIRSILNSKNDQYGNGTQTSSFFRLLGLLPEGHWKAI
jgi:hypothetical protein